MPQIAVQAEAARQLPDDLVVGADAVGCRDDRPYVAEEVMAVGSDEVVVLEHRRGGQHQVGRACRVGEKGVHDHGELARLQSARDGCRIREHRHRIAVADPDHADLGIACLEDARTEQRLGDRARRDIQTT